MLGYVLWGLYFLGMSWFLFTGWYYKKYGIQLFGYRKWFFWICSILLLIFYWQGEVDSSVLFFIGITSWLLVGGLGKVNER